MNRLNDKSVLVTGASSGFGRAIARMCAEEGADVAVLARREDRLRDLAQEIEEMGRQCVVCVADVGDEEQIRSAVDKAQAALGRIDVLVNNAGTNVSQRSVTDTTPDQWRMLLDVNLTSAYLFTRAVLPGMIERGGGTVVNVSSMSAVRPGILGGAAYSASKSGMNALTAVTNEEGNVHNVRACAICPGVANTEILDNRPNPPSQAARQQMMQPEDIAAAVVFVASLPPRVNVTQMNVVPTNIDVA